MKLVKRNPSVWLDNFFADDFFAPFFNNKVAAPRLKQNNLPAVNIKEQEGGYTVEVAAPGMNKEDFSVEVEDGILTISAAQKASKEEKEDGKYSYKEFSYSEFKRSFSLDPEQMEIEGIEASYKDGILSLHIPKRAELPKEEKKLIDIK